MNYKYVEDVTLSEVKKVLTERSKEKELNFEQKNTLEHAKLFVALTPANSAKLKKSLLDIELSDEIATKITDIIPNGLELNLILEKEKDIDDSKKEEILNILKKYSKK
jgi:DNA-directed RNA polymerase subunit F